MDTQSGLTLFNAIATAGRTIYDLAQGTSKVEEKRQLMEVYDTLMNLKREAADLEDQNRDLKEKLRFKSDDFEFRMPFYYEKGQPERALCAKCFVEHHRASPMGEPVRATGVYRRCLVCGSSVQIAQASSRGSMSSW